jgi:hypothetical protein
MLPGDIVTIEMSPYDLSKGRIVYRGPMRREDEATGTGENKPRPKRRRRPPKRRK